MMDDMIEIKLVHSPSLHRYPCDVCGGLNERAYILAKGEAEFGDDTWSIHVCMFCLKEGNIDARLTEHAETKEEVARALRSFIGRLKVPTHEEWQAAEEAYNDEVRKEHEEHERRQEADEKLLEEGLKRGEEGPSAEAKRRLAALKGKQT
jgi:hypothetical protein